VAAAWRSGGWH